MVLALVCSLDGGMQSLIVLGIRLAKKYVEITNEYKSQHGIKLLKQSADFVPKQIRELGSTNTKRRDQNLKAGIDWARCPM